MSLVRLLLKQSYDVMYSAKAIKTQHIAESTFGTVEYFYELEKSGQLTTRQAQEQAKNALSKLRYGRHDYVWINDLNPTMIMHAMSPALDGKDLSGYKDPDGIGIFCNELYPYRQATRVRLRQLPLAHAWR